MSKDHQSRGADIGRLDDMKQVADPTDDSRVAQRRREAAQRALAEAEARRLANAAHDSDRKPVELGGRKGPEPTRFGDWELNGIASDF